MSALPVRRGGTKIARTSWVVLHVQQASIAPMKLHLHRRCWHATNVNLDTTKMSLGNMRACHVSLGRIRALLVPQYATIALLADSVPSMRSLTALLARLVSTKARLPPLRA